MVVVVLHLNHAAACRLVDGALHAVGNSVGIHDHLAVHVAGSTACRLRQTAVRAQESLLVGIEDGHERRSEEHTSELQSRQYLVCRLLLEKKKIEYARVILI